MPRLNAALAALTLLVGAQPAAAQVAEFRDWSVACDNTGACEAVGASQALSDRLAAGEWGDLAMPLLRVTRAAGADAAARVYVYRRLFGEDPASGTIPSLHVLLDPQSERTGRPYRLLPLSEGRHELDPRDVVAFLAESASSDRAATRLDGEIHGLIFTSGMTASLRFIDEVQGRRGTTGAIYAIGPRPAADDHPPAPVPLLTALTGQEGRTLEDEELRERGMLLCGVTAAPHTGMAYPLADGGQLWRVDCGEEDLHASALNPASAWFHHSPSGERALVVFPLPHGADSQALLPNAAFDPATGLLTATHWRNSNRDCGWQRRWAFDGRAWQLVESRELSGCVGVAVQDWPVTWRGRIR